MFRNLTITDCQNKYKSLYDIYMSPSHNIDSLTFMDDFTKNIILCYGKTPYNYDFNKYYETYSDAKEINETIEHIKKEDIDKTREIANEMIENYPELFPNILLSYMRQTQKINSYFSYYVLGYRNYGQRLISNSKINSIMK